MGLDEILHQCVLEHERPWIMSEAHTSFIGVHYAGMEKVHKIWWPTIHMDTKNFF